MEDPEIVLGYGVTLVGRELVETRGLPIVPRQTATRFGVEQAEVILPGRAALVRSAMPLSATLRSVGSSPLAQQLPPFRGRRTQPRLQNPRDLPAVAALSWRPISCHLDHRAKQRDSSNATHSLQIAGAGQSACDGILGVDKAAAGYTASPRLNWVTVAQ
jgi:hypothetical protein